MSISWPRKLVTPGATHGMRQTQEVAVPPLLNSTLGSATAGFLIPPASYAIVPLNLPQSQEGEKHQSPRKEDESPWSATPYVCTESCLVPRLKNVTDRHGQAYKVFFTQTAQDSALLWTTVNKVMSSWFPQLSDHHPSRWHTQVPI